MKIKSINEQTKFQESFDKLKSIAEEFKSNGNISLDQIESKYKEAKSAYNVCKERINSVRELLEEEKDN